MIFYDFLRFLKLWLFYFSFSHVLILFETLIIVETDWDLLRFFENFSLSRLFERFMAQTSQQIEKSLPKYVENWLFVYSNKRKTVNTHLNFQVWTSWLISIKIFGSWKLIKRKLRFLNLNQHLSNVETARQAFWKRQEISLLSKLT